MTEWELREYRWLVLEISDLEQRLQRARDEALEDLLAGALQKQRERVQKIEEYIHAIPCQEIRKAMKMRFLDGQTWEDVSLALNCDRSGISKKVRQYISSA